MRLLLTFIIFILGVFYTFGKENCCEQCCEYLGNCCKKGKEEKEKKEEEEEDDKNNKKEEKKEENEGEKKEENEVQEEAKNLVNENWLNKKKQSKKDNGFVLKIFNMGNENEYKSGDITIKLVEKEGKTKITNLEEVKVKLRTNGQKWALFEIRYKKGTGNEEENKEETKYLYCSDIESIEVYGIFYECKQHVSISVIACDTSGVRDMHHMFSDCEKLNNLNLSNFNTSNVTNMGYMFGSCFSLPKLEFEDNFNTNKVTTMRSIFFNCSSLKTLDLKNFDTKNVTNMGYMFSFCSSLQTLDLSNFDTNKVTTMEGMFSGCSSLTNLDLSKFDTEKVTNMFYNCSSLQTVTFNKSLSEGIKQQLKKLGQWDKQKEGNKITLGKKPQT